MTHTAMFVTLETLLLAFFMGFVVYQQTAIDELKQRLKETKETVDTLAQILEAHRAKLRKVYERMQIKEAQVVPIGKGPVGDSWVPPKDPPYPFPAGGRTSLTEDEEHG
jgi:hypothetical protein